MAAGSAFKARSNSLPSKSHPLFSVVDEQLSRLRTSESSSTSTSLIRKLNSLEDLHESVQKWLQLPSSGKSLDKENVDELLDGFLRLLELCSSTKDALLHTMEHVREIQSILRRRRGSETELEKGVQKYLGSKKTITKAILKALKNLKQKENKQQQHSLWEDVEAVSSNVLESVLFFVAGPELEWKKNGWSKVSKLLLYKKRVGSEEEQGLNEIASAESTLLSLIKGKFEKVQMEDVQVELQKSESCIQDLEERVEALFRHLIKARVALLNMLN